MSITHVTPREMELQAEVTRMEEELSAVKGLHWNAEAKVAELRAKLATLEAQEPFAWYDPKNFTRTTSKKTQRETAPLYLAAGAKEKP